MGIRIPSIIAAFALTTSAVSSLALAQGHAALARAAVVSATADVKSGSYNDITTGSVGYGPVHSSAQEGNAEQNSFPIWQYGGTSGGTVR